MKRNANRPWRKNHLPAALLLLAATLAASYGIYSGFELCENVAVSPGSEEYLHSEKYEIRPRNWNQPGALNELIARVNRIRREHRALQFNGTLAFHEVDNRAFLWFSKAPPSNGVDRFDPAGPDWSARVFVVANTDPQTMQHGRVRVPLQELGLGPHQPYVVEDLLDDRGVGPISPGHASPPSTRGAPRRGGVARP